jgi:hypothetical protein
MAEKRYWRGPVGLALAALAVAFVGCGGTDPSPIKTEIGSGSVALTDPATARNATDGHVTADFGLAAVTINAAGTLEVTVDWGSSSNNVDVGIVKGTCTLEQMLAHQCADPYVSSTTSHRPETLRTTISPGSYTLVVVNFGPGAETVSYKAYLTPSE